MVLAAETAADLMTVNPKSIGHRATVEEATAFLAGRGISAAPVIDDAGRPLGVVSRTDVLIRKRHGATHPLPRVLHSVSGRVNPFGPRRIVKSSAGAAIGSFVSRRCIMRNTNRLFRAIDQVAFGDTA
jgi:CBS domain-containing protein